MPGTDPPPPRLRDLPPPRPVRPGVRALFRPRRGRVRRIERRVNNLLSARVYPRLPVLQSLYERGLRRDLELSRARIPIPGLPREFEGFRILFVTDPHAGPFLAPGVLRRAFLRLLRAVEPDLVLLGGDLITHRLEDYDPAAFAVLRAPLGVFAVLGNHDHYAGEPARLVDRMEAGGVRVLMNRSAVLSRDGARIWLAGIDDHLVGRPDLTRALAGLGSPTILLSHHPDPFLEAARRGVALTLAGHTHGGQVRIPGLPVLVRQSRYRLDEGRYAIGPSQLVISRGLGVTGLPARVACPPEGVEVVLVPVA